LSTGQSDSGLGATAGVTAARVHGAVGSIIGAAIAGAQAKNDRSLAIDGDSSENEAEENRDFWDAWACESCNGGERMSLKQWRAQRAGTGEQSADAQADAEPARPMRVSA
jgi:hypothetical protein